MDLNGFNKHLLSDPIETDLFLISMWKCIYIPNFVEIDEKLRNNGFNGHLLTDLIETDIVLISMWKCIFTQNFIDIAWKLQNNGFLTDISLSKSLKVI